MLGLLIALFAVPWLSSLIIALSLRGSAKTTRGMALVGSGATAVCATLLLPAAGNGPSIRLEWLPGTGPVTLGLSVGGLYALLVTTWAAFLALLGTVSIDRKAPSLSLAAMLLALGAANVAFLTEQFLARYVALEVVALTVALVALVELRDRGGSRPFWIVYLVLRIGDAGLLTAILILFGVSGTLQITPALDSAAGVGVTALRWTLFGLLLAVWVKMGNWPFHIWTRYGRSLSLNTQAWLYGIVMPNLGAYLLYRTTPVLGLSDTAQTISLWLGGGAAMLAVLIALTRKSLRSALIYVGSARGALLIFAAASGTEAAVWLVLLATTPLYLLLFLGGATPGRGRSSIPAWIPHSLFGVGGLALGVVGLFVTFWARETGVTSGALVVTEIAVALLLVWAVRATDRQRADPAPGKAGENGRGPSHPTRWISAGALALGAVGGIVAFGPLMRHLVGAAGVTGPPVPTLPGLISYTITAPVVPLTVALVLLARWVLQRSGVRALVPAALADGRQMDMEYQLDDALVRAARALHGVVEAGLFERSVLMIVQAVVDGALLACRLAEHGGMEGLVKRTGQRVLGLGRVTKRMHTGVLRHNLMWIPLSLALALATALLYW